jgi:hypothetical protein
MTQAAPGGSMPPGSQTFAMEQVRPVRQAIVAEHAAPTPPPGGTAPSPVASPGPPSPPPPPAPPAPASKSKGAVTALELLHPARSAHDSVAPRKRKHLPIAHLVISQAIIPARALHIGVDEQVKLR